MKADSSANEEVDKSVEILELLCKNLENAQMQNYLKTSFAVITDSDGHEKLTPSATFYSLLPMTG